MLFQQFFKKKPSHPEPHHEAEPKTCDLPKEILMSWETHEMRVAVLEKSVLEEFYIERSETERMLGNIYKGKVKSLVPGIGAAFIEMGTRRDGFLYVADALKSPLEEESLAMEEIANHAGGEEVGISDILKVGQEIVVQVVKEPIRTKGPRLTTKFTIPARYLVFMPGDRKIGISRRIEDRRERDRLRRILSEIDIPEDAGCIVRTAAEGVSKKEFERDIRYLVNQWRNIKSVIRKKRAPCLIHRELDLSERTIRDFLTSEVRRVVVDHPDLFHKVKRFLRIYIPDVEFRIELYKERTPLFEKFNIEKDIEKAFHKKVLLDCGGHIVIEQTEGLVSIDVNTGKYAGKSNLEETAYRTNVDAAQEIARQMRLRDMGGIVIIDFIDMEKEEHRRDVLRTFREAVKGDRARTHILQLSELGLVEMTRQRVRPSLESAIYDTCPYCEGKGVVKSTSTLAIQTIKKIRKTLASSHGKTLQVTVHPSVAERLLHQNARAVRAVEKECRNKVTIVADANLHVEDSNMELS
jgi:ribonuclease G